MKTPYTAHTDHILIVKSPHMGHTGPKFAEKVLIYERSANPILEKVLILKEPAFWYGTYHFDDPPPSYISWVY